MLIDTENSLRNIFLVILFKNPTGLWNYSKTFQDCNSEKNSFREKKIDNNVVCEAWVQLRCDHMWLHMWSYDHICCHMWSYSMGLWFKEQTKIHLFYDLFYKTLVFFLGMWV